MSGPRRNRNDPQRRRESGGPRSQQSQGSQGQNQSKDSSSQRQNSQRQHSGGQNRQAQKSGPQRNQNQNRPQKSQKHHRPQSGRDSSTKKKGSIFDLKFDATETIDIPTSSRIFRFPGNSPQVKPDEKRYGVLFFETFAEATQQLPLIEQSSKNFDQLNIVIHQEGSMVNTVFNPFGKVFAGEAWWIVHKRREADGWYQTNSQT